MAELFRIMMNEAMKIERNNHLNANDEDIQAFKERPLGCYPVVYMDAEYQKVRVDGKVVDHEKHFLL